MKKLFMGLLVVVASVVYAQQPKPRSKRPVPTITLTEPEGVSSITLSKRRYPTITITSHEGVSYVTLLSDDGLPVQLRKDLTLLSEPMMAALKYEHIIKTDFSTNNLEVFISALEDIRNFYATKNDFLAANEKQRQDILKGSPEAKVVILPDARATFTNLELLEISLRKKFDLDESIVVLQIGDYFLVPELQKTLPSIIAEKLTDPTTLARFAQQDVSFLDELNVLSQLPQASQIARNLLNNSYGWNAELSFIKTIMTIQHGHPVASAAFSPDGTKVIIARYNGFTKIVDATTGRLIASTPQGGDVITTAFSPDRTKIVTTFSDGFTNIVDETTGRIIASIRHDRRVNTAIFSPDSTKVVTASADGTAKIVDATTGRLIAIIQHDSWVSTAAFSPDSTKVVTASGDGTAKIVNAATGSLIATIENDSGVSTAAFSPDGTKVVTTSAAGTDTISDATTGRIIATIQSGDYGKIAAFSPDSTKVVTGSRDNTAKIVDATTGRIIATIQHGDHVITAAFSPDSTKVVTASDDGTAKIVNATTGRIIATIPHKSRVNTAAFSPDGTKVVTGSSDNTAKITDAITGRLIATIRHGELVLTAAFSPDSTKVITGSGDDTAKITSFFPEVNELQLPQMLFVILLRRLAYEGHTITLDNQLLKIWRGFTHEQQTFLREAYPPVFGSPLAVADLTKQEKKLLRIAQG
jgi:WD40 repeat protein